MARSASRFVCEGCGSIQPRWAGRCGDCGAWNSLVEDTALRPVSGQAGRIGGHPFELVGLRGAAQTVQRLHTGIAELDRVLGGGLVPGSIALVGGDPGVGKSTLMLQAAARLAADGIPIAYASGEESVDQIRLRAARLGVQDAAVGLVATTAVDDLIATLTSGRQPGLLIVDSIQTMHCAEADAAPGTVTQLRTATQALVRFAKASRTAVLLIGHVTKDGQIAGPKLLEHMVDAVLYFEGERVEQFRILRAVKNRFGAANEIGVFEMREGGLAEVPNPSALLLAGREHEVSGSAVFAGMEGSRPLLVEVQALAAPSPLALPRRTAVGWDAARLAMVLAVLEARAGLALAGRDIYLNVAGGLRVSEPAADLAVAAALVSSCLNRPAPRDAIFFGELGLAGEVRAVAHTAARLKEAEKLGFTTAVVPAFGAVAAGGLRLIEVGRLSALIDLFADPGRAPGPP